MTAQQFLTPAEAGKLYPRPVGRATVVRHIRTGYHGIRLEAVFDGYRYLTKEEWILSFVQRITDTRTRVQIVETPDDVLMAQLLALKPTSGKSRCKTTA